MQNLTPDPAMIFKKKISLLVLCLLGLRCLAQPIPYGSNPDAGRHIQVGEARLYYEVYGQGPPLLLLHGAALGYIDEFHRYIPLLSQHYRVLAVGMRGHGRSELGDQPLTYRRFAEDALAILARESQDSATVVGFSLGAITAYYLAAHFPDRIRKVVAMGGSLHISGYTPEALVKKALQTAADYERMAPDLVSARKGLMPQPQRYPELIERLRVSQLEPVKIEELQARAIHCPVLTVGGDRDNTFRTEQFVEIHRLIPRSQLAIIPNCDHVGLLRNPDVFKSTILPFLLEGM